MRVIALFASFLLGCSFFSHSILHNLARAYQKLYAVVHYDCKALYNENCKKELAWNQKIFCLNEFATDQVWDFLRNIEESEKSVICLKRKRSVEESFFGEEKVVVKSMEFSGFFANLFRMGMGVNIWNNAELAKKKGVSVLKPVALVEKRAWNKSKTFIVYKFEGKACEKEIQKSQDWFHQIQKLQKLLTKKHLVHDDFRIKNMVLLDDGSLQLIDIDKIHEYPSNSVVFSARMKREVRKFNQNLLENIQTTKKLGVESAHWNKSILHNLMCLYRSLFMMTHYGYACMNDAAYVTKLSWKEKIFCKKEYATLEVMRFLHDIDETQEKRILWNQFERTGAEAFFGKTHVIIKSIELDGFFQNFFRMGAAVNIWNNAHAAQKEGVPVLKPIALVEKRGISKTKGFVVYLYEGEVCNKNTDFRKIEGLRALLQKHQIAHHDFYLRNIVMLEDGSLQLIDIDKMHWYPKHSYLFRKKCEIEENRLIKDFH
jgi:hypothetical protein